MRVVADADHKRDAHFARGRRIVLRVGEHPRGLWRADAENRPEVSNG